MEIYPFTEMVARVTYNFGPFYSKDFPSGASSFMGKLIINLSWILEAVEEVALVLKLVAVLKATLEVVVDDLEKVHRRNQYFHTIPYGKGLIAQY